MLKNPMVANIQAIRINSKPIMNIVRMDPIHSKLAAVLKEFSPDFFARVSKVRFRFDAASM